MIKSLRFLAVATVAAFALAACDETPDVITGTISGSVTIEGDGASGVTVSLSSGASTTTDASGAYSFANVDAGSYVVTISGFAADASFSSTSQTAVIASAGQVASANFSGSYIRTSGIVGNVSVATVGPIAGVTVNLSGAGTASTQTDAAGQYAFTGLRAGNYTVTISDPDANNVYNPNSKTVTVGAGATEVVSFSGSLAANASISGALYFDENDKNDTYDGAALEELLAAPNVLITLNGPSIGQTQTTQTDSTGAFSFTDLVAGTYAVVISDTDTDIPASVTFGGVSNTTNVTVTAGGSATVYFPFDITQQTVKVCQFTGLDAVSPGHNPVAGGDITLYFLETDLQAGTNAHATQTTDASGCTDFVFARSADVSPQPGLTDNIVYAEIGAAPAGYFANGETSFEIAYNPKTASSLAPDTFDVQSNAVTIGFDAVTVTGIDSLSGWGWDLWDDSASATALSIANDITDGPTNAQGAAYAVLPLFTGTIDTLWARVDSTAAAQPTAGNAPFNITPLPADSTAPTASQYLGYVRNGFNLITDTVWLGTNEIKFTAAQIAVTVYHEADDSLVTPMFTAGDDMAGVDEITVSLWLQGPDSLVFVTSQNAAAGTGLVDFGGAQFFTDSTYAISAIWDSTTAASPRNVLMPIMYTGLQEWNGASPVADQCQLMGSAGCATFAHKYQTAGVGGFIQAADGSDADGIAVRIQADSMTIEGNPVDTTVYSGAGIYLLQGMAEGVYTISVSDSVTSSGDTVWAFADSLRTCTADAEGDGIVDNTCNFTPTRMDTKVMGVVVNDRDGDGNTVDPNEALPGATINLYSGASTDSTDLVATTTTSANGNYGFSKLPEGTYTVQVDGSTAGLTGTALQALTAAGVPIDTQVVHTAATATGLGADMTRQVGDTVPGTNGLSVLPAWDYATSVEGALGAGNPTHFTYLADDTQITGSIVDGSAAAAVGVTVTLQRCVTSPVAPTSPPVSNGTCTTTFPGTPMNFVTGADGMFSFSNLQGGRYQVTVNPVTGGFSSSNPATLLYETKEPGDIEAAAAAIVVN